MKTSITKALNSAANSMISDIIHNLASTHRTDDNPVELIILPDLLERVIEIKEQLKIMETLA